MFYSEGFTPVGRGPAARNVAAWPANPEALRPVFRNKAFPFHDLLAGVAPGSTPLSEAVSCRMRSLSRRGT